MSYAKRLLKAIATQALETCERRFALPALGASVYAPIFIVAPPRSGSTLLYQLITARYRSCYFANFMMRFPGAPVTLALLTRPFFGWRSSGQFSSYYGNAPSWRDPAQAYEIWNRWFPPDRDWVPAGALSEPTVREMRATVQGMQKVSRAPFVNKWQRHAMRIGAIADALPEAFFLRLTRDYATTAYSILRGRREFLGDEHAWMSARPRACDDVEGKTPVEQVSAQVHFLEQEISDGLDSLDGGRYLTIAYEDLCRDVHSELARFENAYRQFSGHSLVARHPVPGKFDLRSQRREDVEEFDAIRDEIQRLNRSNASY